MNTMHPFRRCIPVLLGLMLLFAAMACSAQIYFDLYNFDQVHGDSPSDPQVMAQGQDGNLYGTVPEV